MPKLILIILSYIALCAPTYAVDYFETQLVPFADKVGQGRLSYLFWDVYDATLWAPNGQWDKSKPFALTLNYLVEIEGVDIADRSAEEIRKLGFDDEVRLAAWHAQMRTIFPNVASGSSLTGVFIPGEPTRFYHGEHEVGMVRDAAFGKWFFSIWLSENTSEPELRSALLGV